MKNKSFILMIITFLIFFCGCIQSDIGNINDIIPSINDHLKKGNEFYNKAAMDANNYYYATALSNSNKAYSEFNLARASADRAMIYADNSNDRVFIEYVQYANDEVNAKLNATSEIKLAISSYQKSENRTGNYHARLANGFMAKSLEYRYKRDQIAKETPSKFKK
jgi:hypothetical protein